MTREATASRRERLLPLLREAGRIVWERRRRFALALPLIALNRLTVLVVPGTTKFLVDDVFARQRLELLPWLALAAGGAAVLEAICGHGLVVLLGMEAQKSIADYRRRLHAHILRLPTKYFDRARTGDLMSRTMWDPEALRHLVGTGLVQVAAALVTAAGTLAILVWLSPILAAAVAATLVVFVLAFGVALRMLRPLYRDRSEWTGRVFGRLSEGYTGIRTVKAFQAEEREAEDFSGGVERILANVLSTMRVTSGLNTVTTLLVGAVAVAILLVGGRLVIEGRMSVGDLVSFTLYFGVMVAPLAMLVGAGSQIVEALAGLERIRQILDEETEDHEDETRRPLDHVDGFVEVRELTFDYGGGTPALVDVSFTARPGTTTALVGRSGAGKSTLAALVAGLYRSTAGMIFVDGHDLAEARLADYRRHVAIVSQETFLFDCSLRENIAVGRPTATEDEVVEAARRAHVLEFAESLADGLDTVIGERGVRLSGGQRQRVAIARALVADPRILVLDEATSSMDSASEAFVREAMADLVEGRTTFVIAHRLSTIRRADQILVLEAGRIVERGAHEELIAMDGVYRRMIEAQKDAHADLYRNPGEEPPIVGERRLDGVDEDHGTRPPDLLLPEGW